MSTDIPTKIKIGLSEKETSSKDIYMLFQLNVEFMLQTRPPVRGGVRK
jgi:hypothetical protein